MIKNKRIVIYSLLLNLFLCGIIIYQNWDIIKPKEKVKVVFWGDSITASGNWNKLLNRNDVLNAGTKGYTTLYLMSGFDDAILKYKPDTCYLMIGINDIRLGVPMSRTKSNYSAIIDSLVKYKITPVIQSTLYTTDNKINCSVDTLNGYIKAIAANKNIKYLDVNARISNNHVLTKKYSLDGLHINPLAYLKWVGLIKIIQH